MGARAYSATPTPTALYGFYKPAYLVTYTCLKEAKIYNFITTDKKHRKVQVIDLAQKKVF